MRAFRRLIILAAAVTALAACGPKSGGSSAGGGAGGHTLGKPDAPVKVIEYASMSCPHCMDFNNKEFPAFKAKYIDTGKVQYELREMLTPPETLAAAGFRMAECSGDAKYFETIDAFFKALPQIAQNNQAGMLAVAREVGMSQADLDRCLADEPAMTALGARVEQNSTKATGTPTFYINGVETPRGTPHTTEALGKLIDAALAAK